MPAGQNANNNLNVLLFEVVMVQRDPDTGDETVRTVSVHPLVVAPQAWSWTDSTRSTAIQTAGGGAVNRGGRAWRMGQFSGEWGVRSVGLFPYIGTGEVRHERFYNEVVRMSDAIEKGDVDAAVNVLTGTPGLKAILAPYYADPDNTVFAINLYDFWHQLHFQVLVPQYQWSRGAGAASGNISYRIAVQEAGPPVVGAAGTALLTLLFDGLTIWNDVNEAIKSYNVQTLANSAFGVAAILQGQIEDTLDAVLSQIEAVTGLVAGFQSSENSQLSAFLANAADLDNFAQEALDAILANRTETLDNETGEVQWSAEEIEAAIARSLDESDVLDDLEDLIDSLRWQPVAGRLFGFSDAEYRRYLSAGGSDEGGVRVAGTVPHLVTAFDTPETLERIYGVDFEVILARNNLLPDEALLAGEVLEIPTGRLVAGGQPIDGLPTFGSHIGEAAWGADLTPGLEIDPDDVNSGLRKVSGADILEQGVDWILEDSSDELLRFANLAPDVVRTQSVEERVQALLLEDPRFESVALVEVVYDDDAISIDANVIAINGGQIQGNPS